MIDNTENVTWAELAEIEPELLIIEANLKAIKDNKRNKSFCANAIWFGYPGHSPSYKMWMHRLVGSYVRKDNPRLITSEAYDCAYHHLYDILPDCRNCACIGF